MIRSRRAAASQNSDRGRGRGGGGSAWKYPAARERRLAEARKDARAARPAVAGAEAELHGSGAERRPRVGIERIGVRGGFSSDAAVLHNFSLHCCATTSRQSLAHCAVRARVSTLESRRTVSPMAIRHFDEVGAKAGKEATGKCTVHLA